MATRCRVPGSDSGSRSLLLTLIIPTTGFGAAVGVLIDAVEDCAGGGGPVGTLDAFGTICGFPLKR